MSRSLVALEAMLLPLALIAGASAVAAAPTSYPMTEERWHGTHVSFATGEAFPEGLMTVADGLAEAGSIDFADGTIDVDIKPLAYSDTGVLFHRAGATTGEFVYLRADPDCPAADDCVQYAPINNGRMQWNAYSRYQGGVPLAEKGWNHMRIVVSHGRMRLYVNGSPAPALDVPHLEGLSDRGGLALKGPAIYANLTIKPDDAEVSSPPAPIERAPHGQVLAFLFGPVTPAPVGRPLTAADAPRSGWKTLVTDPVGLANLARVIPQNMSSGFQVAWLKASVDAATETDKEIDLGFVPRAWLYVNGAPAYAGENFYYPEDHRLAPAGRLSPANAKVKVHLRKGRNELLLALDDAWRRPNNALVQDHYGWAAMLRFEDPTGITIGP